LNPQGAREEAAAAAAAAAAAGGEDVDEAKIQDEEDAGGFGGSGVSGRNPQRVFLGVFGGQEGCAGGCR
jgi:hypothetical protein